MFHHGRSHHRPPKQNVSPVTPPLPSASPLSHRLVGSKVGGRNRTGPCEAPRGSPPCSLGVWPGVLFPYLINVSGNAPWLQHELQDPQVSKAASPQSPGRQAPHQAVPAVEQILKAKEHSSHASSLCESPQIPCSEATS